MTLFVLRRAWLMGVCTRSDINRILGLQGKEESNTRAAKRVMLLAAKEAYPDFLKHIERKGVYPATEREAPPQVTAETILDLMAREAPPIVTGLFPEDFPVLTRPLLPSRASDTKTTAIVFQAGLKDRPLEILYAGLRARENARWRRILIRAFEHTGSYWRLHAQDLDAEGFPVKSYVLGRILDAKELDGKLLKKLNDFRPRAIIRNTSRLRVFYADVLTPDQKRGIAGQFGIGADGVLLYPEHAVRDFCRENGPRQDDSSIVWPLFARIDTLPE